MLQQLLVMGASGHPRRAGRSRADSRSRTDCGPGCGSVSGAGFSLMEVLIASGLIVSLAAGVARLTAASIEAVRVSGDQTTALLLAVWKMEQLRSLTWSRDPADASPRSDLVTDLSRDPPGPGGVGLRASPADSLDRSAPGYADYLNAAGAWVGAGATAPPGASFVRRWSVRPSPLAPDDLLALDVVVAPLPVFERAGASPVAPNTPGVVWLGSLTGRR